MILTASNYGPEIEHLAIWGRLARELANLLMEIVSAHIKEVCPPMVHGCEIDLVAQPKNSIRIDYSGHSALHDLVMRHQVRCHRRPVGPLRVDTWACGAFTRPTTVPRRSSLWAGPMPARLRLCGFWFSRRSDQMQRYPACLGW